MLSGPRPSISSTQGRFSDCFIAHSEWPQAGHRRGLTLAHTTQETPEPATYWASTDHVRAPPPCPCTADPPQKADVGGQWSQPVLAAYWTEEIPPIYLPTATKAPLQEKSTLSPHKRCTSSTQLE